MNILFKTCLTLAFLVISQFSFSQANNDLITHTHYYSFSGDATCNKEQINKMQEELLKIEFVTDVLIKYSDEKKSGLIKVITQEKPVVNERDHTFSAVSLKNTLLNYKLSPINYSSEDGAK